MLEQLYKSKTTYKAVFIDPKIERLSTVKVERDGRLCSETQYVKDCVEDNNKQFTIVDFSLSSIQSVGAYHLLKPVSMSNHDYVSIGSKVDNVGQQLDAAIQNQSQNQSQNQ